MRHSTTSRPMRRSHASTMSVAPPYTLPLRAQIVTGRRLASLSGIRSKKVEPWPFSSKPPMSKPAQNTGLGWPAVLAVSTSTRTLASRSTASKCSSSLCRSPFSSLLRWAGRFRVMVATPSAICRTGALGWAKTSDMGGQQKKKASEDAFGFRATPTLSALALSGSVSNRAEYPSPKSLLGLGSLQGRLDSGFGLGRSSLQVGLSSFSSLLGHFLQGFGSGLAGFVSGLEGGHGGVGTGGGVLQVGFHDAFHSSLAFGNLGFHGLAQFGAGGGSDVIQMRAVGHGLFEGGLHQSSLSGQQFLGVLGVQQGLGGGERLAHGSLASGQVQFDHALETGESGLRQAGDGVQVGFAGSSELFSVEVHDGFLEERLQICCSAAIAPRPGTHDKGKPAL